MQKIFTGSWKTTIGGIASILTGVGVLAKLINDLMLGHPLQYDQIAIALTAIGAGFTGLTARDNDKSSQDVGIR